MTVDQLNLEANVAKLRQHIARKVAQRVRRSRLAEDVTKADREDAVAVGLTAVFQPVAPLDENGVPQVGSWWDRYGAEVMHRDALVVQFGADRAMQWLAREAAKRRREDAAWLVHVLPLVQSIQSGDPTGRAAVRSVIREKQRARVRAAVEALDKPERMVIEARYWAGETWANIASTHDISVGKAHRLHDAALRQLAYWLRPAGNTGLRG